MTDKMFTPTQATRTLPLVKKIVADILERGRELRELQEKDEDQLTVVQEDRKNVLEDELKDYYRELEQLGCSFRDWGFELGLVDFPSEIEGKPVLLCWRSDEPSVRFYHTPEAGYAGRRPIPPLLLEVKPS